MNKSCKNANIVTFLTLLCMEGGTEYPPPLKFWSLEPSRVIGGTPNFGTIQKVVAERVRYFVLLNYSYNSWSIIKTRDMSEFCSS